MTNKQIIAVHGAPHGHWVGDGFPVRSLFSYDRFGAERISPFLLLDHAGPWHFSPASKPRGVGSHPHRGFETVTFVSKGEVAHRDSTGAGGTIGPGEVQWMTAGAGIIHEEFHSEAFTREGGDMEMLQLWVNLPARDKNTPPAYQTLTQEQIPELSLGAGIGTLRVVAGEYQQVKGPARTFTPVNAWQVTLEPGAEIDLTMPEDHTSLIVVQHGTVLLQGETLARTSDLVELSRDGQQVTISANNEVRLLVLSGEPIDEPVVGHGPFVMNSEAEIRESFEAFQQGRFGALATGEA